MKTTNEDSYKLVTFDEHEIETMHQDYHDCVENRIVFDGILNKSICMSTMMQMMYNTMLLSCPTSDGNLPQYICDTAFCLGIYLGMKLEARNADVRELERLNK